MNQNKKKDAEEAEDVEVLQEEIEYLKANYIDFKAKVAEGRHVKSLTKGFLDQIEKAYFSNPEEDAIDDDEEEEEEEEEEEDAAADE